MGFIGRDHEIRLIEQHVNSGKAELGIVYGRRRVGKSTLLKKFVGKKGDLYFEGLEKAGGHRQIDHFMDQLARQTGSMRILAKNWRDAFDALTSFIHKGRHYVVFDEFPWMAASRTELVSLLKYYWDNVWKNNRRLTLVICGSVASFMIKHLVHSRALHNRKTFEIQLGPLSAREARLFFRNKRADFEVLKFLMVFGGIPKYLEQIDPNRSLFENIDKLCFQRNCFFYNEFETLFKEQFKVIQHYGEIVQTLSELSLSQEGLAKKLKVSAGGGLTTYIQNLERADFVRSFHPYPLNERGRKTRRIYLWDEWLRFYFTFMHPHRGIIAQNTKPGLFEQIAGNSLPSYYGLAFERLCLKNITSILTSLGSGLHQVKGFGPYFRQIPRKKAKRQEGLQIDILIEKRGRVLTLVECKFSENPVGLPVINEVERKTRLLKAPRNYTLEKVLIAPGGVTAELSKSDYFHHILGVEALFHD